MVFAVKVSLLVRHTESDADRAAAQPAHERGNDGPVQFFGIASTVLLSVALLQVPSLCYQR